MRAYFLLHCCKSLYTSRTYSIFFFYSFFPRPEVTCDQLQDAGLTGQVPLAQCPLLPPLLSVCDCAPGDLPTDPPAPTDPPGGPTPCPDVPADGCSVCGEGLCVTIPDGIFVFPNQPSTPCNILEQAGFDGLVPIESCKLLLSLLLSLKYTQRSFVCCLILELRVVMLSRIRTTLTVISLDGPATAQS